MGRRGSEELRGKRFSVMRKNGVMMMSHIVSLSLQSIFYRQFNMLKN